MFVDSKKEVHMELKLSSFSNKRVEAELTPVSSAFFTCCGENVRNNGDIPGAPTLYMHVCTLNYTYALIDKSYTLL